MRSHKYIFFFHELAKSKVQLIESSAKLEHSLTRTLFPFRLRVRLNQGLLWYKKLKTMSASPTQFIFFEK